MVAADRLFDLGIHLMETADHAPASPRLARAIQFRDGLIIALLAARPIRRSNLAGIRVGRNLIKVGETWLLQFCEAETKNRQPLEFPVPDRLVPYLERYLSDIRPSFSCTEEHDGLWASAMGRPMTGCAIYERVCKRTEAAFGQPINLHLFRSCAATSLAIEDPEHVLVARDLLGHSRLETTERFYNQAQSLDASRRYNKNIAALRRTLMRPHNQRRTATEWSDKP
jgi:integrase